MPDNENTEERRISGLAFLGPEFTPEQVEITVEHGIIREIAPSRVSADRCILPAFFNAHTHIGDTVAMDTPADRPLAELVAPPDGIKHRILRSTPVSELKSGMISSMEYMKRSGTLGFADFREGGYGGTDLLASVLNPEIETAILGRDGGELHPAAAGWGLSSASGSPDERRHAEEMHTAGKLVAVHAGETGPADIAAAFDMNPDLIIHAVHFTDKDIRHAADTGISVAVCPRSNWILHASGSRMRPPVRELLDAGVKLMLGTDNAMFVPPDMFSECAFLMNVYGISAKDTLAMATAGFSLCGKPSGIAKGYPAHFTVLDGYGLLRWSRDPLRTALTRLGMSAVREVIAGSVRISAPY